MKKTYIQPRLEEVALATQMIMTGSPAVGIGNGGNTSDLPGTTITSD